MRTANSSALTKPALAALIAAALAAGPGAARAQIVTPSPQPLAAAAPAAPGVEAIASQSPVDGKNLSAMENRATEDANGVIKNLDSSSDSVTLEDINKARRAVARIDAMIEVEKRLVELQKLRDGGHSSSLAAAIPASALTPPPAINIAAPAREEPPPVVRHVAPPPVAYEISRISGSDGVYSAVLRHGSDIRAVKVGDTLPDGGVVRWISPSSVLVERGGSTHSLHIRETDAMLTAVR